MKTVLMTIMLVLVTGLAVPAVAADYTIGFFTDEDASSCEIYNVDPEIIRIHMLFYGDAGSGQTVAFYAPTPACWDAVWLGDEITDGFLYLGSTHSEMYGLSVTFTTCREFPVRIGSMSFYASGSQRCCTYDAYPTPNEDYIVAVDCDYPLFNQYPATHESVVINPDASCGCTASSVVSTEETTWGRVKALYR